MLFYMPQVGLLQFSPPADSRTCGIASSELLSSGRAAKGKTRGRRAAEKEQDMSKKIEDRAKKTSKTVDSLRLK